MCLSFISLFVLLSRLVLRVGFDCINSVAFLFSSHFINYVTNIAAAQSSQCLQLYRRIMLPHTPLRSTPQNSKSDSLSSFQCPQLHPTRLPLPRPDLPSCIPNSGFSFFVSVPSCCHLCPRHPCTPPRHRHTPKKLFYLESSSKFAY